MALKSGTERFDEALETLLSLGAMRGLEFYNGYRGVLVWLGKQPNHAVAKNAVGSQISVGGFFSDKHPLAIEIRKSLRALLLLKITCNEFLPASVIALKRVYDGARYPHQLIEINSQIKQASLSIPLTGPAVVIDKEVSSYADRLGFPNIAQVLNAARDSGNQILREAHAYMKSPSKEKLLYTRWFGDFEANFDGKRNREIVEDNIRKVMDAYATKPLRFAFTSRMDRAIATSVQQRYEEFCERTHIKVNLAEHFFLDTASHSSKFFHDAASYAAYFDQHLKLQTEESSARQDILREADGIYSDLVQCDRNRAEVEAKADADPRIIDLKRKIVENADRLPRPSWAGRVRKISVAGVVVHEATHQIVNTRDVPMGAEIMYGSDNCYWLARKYPQLAITNADNYRLFCEEFLLAKSLQTT